MSVLSDAVSALTGLASDGERPEWRRKLGPASFRGVSFHVETVELAGGRRGVKHEYPGKETAYTEDMGRKARSFPVEGYVIGDNYFTLRDALLKALEQPGSGELVHPYYGTRRVFVSEYRVRESTREGGLASFSITFDETDASPTFPTAVDDGAALVASSVAAARDSVVAEFLSAYDKTGKFLDETSESLRKMTRSVNNAVRTINSSTQKLARLKKRLTEYNAAVATLVRTPETLASKLVDIFGDLDDNLLSVYGFNPGRRPPATTPSRKIEQSNFDQVQRLVQRLAVIRAAELAPSKVYDSFESAVAARSSITDLLDEQCETVSDDTYPALLQLRADLVKAVPGDDSDLARLVSYTPAATVPSVVLAYQLYGSLDLEADIIARNRVKHPGFLVQGKALEVLSRD
jgi:prophage DNA circulation protein